MDANRKKLIQLRTKLEFYKKLDKKLEQVLNAELEIEDWSSEVYNKLSGLENELDDLKMEMDLPDEEWDEDEGV
jgi:predicted component of type VI protein secretion system